MKAERWDNHIEQCEKEKEAMTFIPEKQYELPSEGPHVAVLAEEIDLGIKNTVYGPKDFVKLIFLVNQLDSKGQPIQVHVQCAKTRDRRGNLYDFVRALSYPAPLTRDSWDLSKYVGNCVVLDIIHNQKADATYANVERVSVLPKNSPRLNVPASYVRRGGQRNEAADAFFAEAEAREAKRAKPVSTATQGKDIRLSPGQQFITGTPQEDDGEYIPSV